MTKRAPVPKKAEAWAIWINYAREDEYHAGHFFPYCGNVPTLFKTESEARSHSLGASHSKIVRVRMTFRG